MKCWTGGAEQSCQFSMLQPPAPHLPESRRKGTQVTADVKVQAPARWSTATLSVVRIRAKHLPLNRSKCNCAVTAPPCLTVLIVKVPSLSLHKWPLISMLVNVGAGWNVWNLKFVSIWIFVLDYVNSQSFDFIATALYRKRQCNTDMLIMYDWTNWGRVHEMRREGGVVDLSVLLFDDEWSNVVPCFLVVFGVGSVTVRELLWLPAAAEHSLGADVLHVKAVDHFGAVFTDGCVHLALFTASPTQVMAD